MKKIPLTEIKSNHKGRVVEVLGGTNAQSRLMNMGVYKGREVPARTV